MLSVPIRLRDQVIGVMRVYTSETREFGAEEVEFVQAVANLGAIALENARRFGMTLPPAFRPRLARACEFAVHCLRPDGEIPALSDVSIQARKGELPRRPPLNIAPVDFVALYRQQLATQGGPTPTVPGGPVGHA